MKKVIVFMMLVQFIFASRAIAGEERFVSSELIVKDRKNYLVWTKDANILGKAMTWDDALKAVKNLNDQKYAGLQCWRLPERNELFGIWHHKSQDNKFFSEFFEHVQQQGIDLYWSATRLTSEQVTKTQKKISPDGRWGVSMLDGYTENALETSRHYLWPVCDYDNKEKEEIEKQIAEEKRRKEQIKAEEKKIEEAAATKQREKSWQEDFAHYEAKQKEKVKHLKVCNGQLLSLAVFLNVENGNPHANVGKCIEFFALVHQRLNPKAGLFEIAPGQIAYIAFKEPFRERGVMGIAQITGAYRYVTRSGYVREVPYFKMLKIEHAGY